MKKTLRIMLGLTLAALGVGACSDQPTAPATTVEQVAPAFGGGVQIDTTGGGATTQSDTTCRGGTLGGGGRQCQ